MHRILFTGNTLSDEAIQDLKHRGFEIIPARTDFSEDELIDALKGIDGYILGGDEIATKRVIDSASQLKIIGFLGTGYERFVDVPAASSRGIIVTNTPGANAYTVAEFTTGLILDTVKKLSYLNRSTKMGGWEKREVWNLRGRILGIVGMGTIGRYVAKILHTGYGMHVLYSSRTSKPAVEAEIQAIRVDLPALLERADIVSLHVSDSADTLGMIGETELAMMRPDAILVNTARAELVDGLALCRALQAGTISMAAFDGYYLEPIPQPSEDPYSLLTLPDDKFLITPHTAYNSKDAVQGMEKMAVTSIITALEGGEPDNVVNPNNPS